MIHCVSSIYVKMLFFEMKVSLKLDVKVRSAYFRDLFLKQRAVFEFKGLVKKLLSLNYEPESYYILTRF